MRLRELSLQRYGNFETLDLTFGTEPRRIELVVAPNGAGKSVLRQAIGELLFGIQAQTPMGFRFGYDGMRIRAQAAVGGETFGFIRRKGRLNTLTDAQGGPLDPRLAALLPHDRDRPRLERLFALDSAQLVGGGKALLQSGGDLADALLSGAGELRPARDLVAALRAQRDAVAPMRKTARAAFHEAAETLRGANLRMRQALIRPQEWQARQARLEAAAAARAAANAAAHQQLAAVARLHRVRNTRRHLEALNGAAAWLDANLDAPILPPDLAEHLKAARHALLAAQADHAARHHRLTELLAQHAGLIVDDAALATEAAIAMLAEERGRARQSRADIPQRASALDGAYAAVAVLLRQLGSAADPAHAAAEVRARADIETARRLILQHATLGGELAEAPARVERLRRAEADAFAALAALPPQAQTEAVDALVTEITADGTPGSAAERLRQTTAAAAEAVRAAVARAPRWRGSADAIIALPAIALPEVTRLDGAVQAALNAVQQAAAQLARDAASATRLRRSLREQSAGGPLPDRAAVLNARAFRDNGWRLIYARLLGQTLDPADLQEFAGSHRLELAYIAAISAADEVADRRADETERLQRITQFTETLAEAEAALAITRSEHDRCAAVLVQARTAWAAICDGMGLPGDATLAEAREFIEARAAVIEAAAACRRADADVNALTRRHAAWTERLTAALGGDPAGPLDAALATAQLTLKRARETEQQRAALRGTLKAAQDGLRDHGTATQQAQERLAAWSTDWAAVLGRLGRPPGEPPEAVGTVLDLLGRLEAETGRIAELQTRLAQMRSQLSAFETDAAQLATRLAISEDDAIAAVEAAMRRLDAAQRLKSRADTLHEQAEAAAADLRRAAARQDAAARSLAEVLRDAGAAEIGDAERRIRLSMERAAQAERRQTALERLREDGDGHSPAELQAMADAVPADALTVQIAEAEAAMQAAQAAAQREAATEEGLRRDLQALSEAGGEAGDLAQAAGDRAAAESRIGRVLEDALVHHTAASMLEQALASVEASGDDPRLTRIGQAFAALTRGAYDRVSAGELTQSGKTHRVLLAHAAGSTGETQVDELSEGTRDQLYLALRLVAIEDHAAASPVLPFIADDILQTFDDSRALAAFDALLRLSTHTQVIVLTHHEHLAALAQALPEGACRVQRI